MLLCDEIFQVLTMMYGFVTPTHFVQEIRLIVRSLGNCLSFHSFASIFLREYLTLRRSPTSSIASRACWMITASKSITLRSKRNRWSRVSWVRAWEETCVLWKYAHDFPSSPPTPTISKQGGTESKKRQRREISCNCSLGFRLTFNWLTTRSCCELIGGIDAPRALQQCNPELWFISPYPAFLRCVKLKDKFLLSPRSVKWPGTLRWLQLRFVSTFHEKRLCNKILNTFEWLSSVM